MINIRLADTADKNNWDDYVMHHPRGTIFHLTRWKNVIEKTFGHKSYYLIAVENTVSSTQYAIGNERSSPCAMRPVPCDTNQQPATLYELSTINPSNPINPIVGILPLVHLKHFLFGNSLISIPFFDMGGILADNDEIEKALLCETIKLGKKLKVKSIELRQTNPIACLAQNLLPTETLQNSSSFRQSRIESSQILLEAEKTKRSSQSCKSCQKDIQNWAFQIRSHKVRMLLDLPESSEILMKSFKAKLRSQIKKPIKEGLKSKVGSVELLDDFYKVFLINMRDLGSPVHSKKFMQNVLEEFPEKSMIVLVYNDEQPVACSMVVGFKRTLENPWASALREYSRLSPNMLLYWTMLEYACDNGYNQFDFGRSTPGEGTHKFKEQWGAKPELLHWHYISMNGEPVDTETSEKSKFEKAIHYWQKLPVSITKIIGPPIRKHIGL